jgi:ferredoxin--NADP+ reductase
MEKTLSQPGTEAHPLRVAIVGAGPAGFFVAEQLLKRKDLSVQVDMYERLPAPFGLVRFGVAPDHQRIKAVTRTFQKVASHDGFRLFGNVEVGGRLSLDDLRQHYHQVCFATGAQVDRRLNIPGEDLRGSHSATEFVAWYNGHPDYSDLQFDLSAESVAVVGVGNVALDVARVLCRPVDELARTDIADYALEALSNSEVKEVVLLGRRGPVQAAFSATEIREMGQLSGVDAVVPPDDMLLDPLSQVQLSESDDRALERKIEVLNSLAREQASTGARRVTLRFLVSPIELLGTDDGRVEAVKLVRNELFAAAGGLRSRPTEHTEVLSAGLVFRSVGYLGIPVSDLPFDDERSVIPNEKGRVVDPVSGVHLPGMYVSGWVKRQAVGIIGTNKPDAAETVAMMLADVESCTVLRPAQPSRTSAESTVRAVEPDYVSFDDWEQLDAFEIAQGKATGRPRVKLTSTEDMLIQLGRSRS